MSVLNKEMYLKFILIITGQVYYFIITRSSAFAQQQECRAFVTQGLRKHQTVISLHFNDNQGSGIGFDIDNRLNTYEWNVQASTIIGNKNNTVDQPLNNLCTSATQRMPCFLLAWESVNALKNQLQKTQVNVESSGKVEVKIENDLVVPNIFYKIELKMIRYGKALGIQCFELSANIKLPINNENISYSASENHESNKANHLELVLIGPDRIFCSTALFINAFVVGNCTHATFQWKLKESPGAAPEILEYQGSRLKIPENTLKNARTYEIICELKENDVVLISSSLNVAVRKPKYFVRLQNKNQTLGANQPIKIIANMIVPSTEAYEIIWTCTYQNHKCGQFYGVSTLYISKGFSKPGLYQFDLTVRNIGFNQQLSAFVKVISLNRSIEFNEIPLWVKPSEILEVKTHIMNIYSGCTLEWKSVHELYQDEICNQNMPLNLTKTNYDRRSAVFVNRDSFLKELAPHSNDPGNQKITLKISPDALHTTQDAKFFLRCNTTCSPENIIFADIEIVINASPICNDLKIYPESGSALLTIFRFETSPAKDKPTDFPLTYSFGWYAYTGSRDGTDNIISDDFSKSDGLLGTVMLVCDNKDSCRSVQGPVIEVKSPESISENSHSTIKNEFSCDLASNNFNKFTTDMLNAFKSYKSLQNEMLLDDLQMAVNSYLNQKIKNLLYKFNKNSVHELISALTATEYVFEPSTEVLMNVMKLRGKLINEEMAAQIVTEDEREALDVIKDVENKNVRLITVQDIRKYFEATEFIITTSDDPNLVNQEKVNFITNMDKYLMKVCVLLYKDPKRVNFKFKLQTAYIVLEKFVNAYFRNFRYVPNSNNEWNANVQILLNQSWHMDVQDKKLCIGKAILKDYLNHKGLLYYAQLFNNDMSKLKMDKQPNTIKKSTTTPNKFKCSAYYDGGWKQCRKGTVGSSNLICMCNKLGIFKMEDAVDESGHGEADGSDTSQGSDNSSVSIKGNSSSNNTTNPSQGSEINGNSGGNTSSSPNQESDNGSGNVSGNNTTNSSGSGSNESNSDNNNTTITNEESGNDIDTENGINGSNIGDDSNTESVATNTLPIGANSENSGNGNSEGNNTDGGKDAVDESGHGEADGSDTSQGSDNSSVSVKGNSSSNNTTNPSQGFEITEGNSGGNTSSDPNQGLDNGSGNDSGNNTTNSSGSGSNESNSDNNNTTITNEESGNEFDTGNDNKGSNIGEDSNTESVATNTLPIGTNSENSGNGNSEGNNTDGGNCNNATHNPINTNLNRTNTDETTVNPDSGIETGPGDNSTNNGDGSSNPSNEELPIEKNPNENNGNRGNIGDNGSKNNTTLSNDEGQNNEIVSTNNGTENNGNGCDVGGDPDETALEDGSDGDNVTYIETENNTINNSSSNENGNGTDRNNNANGTNSDRGKKTTNPESGDDNSNPDNSENLNGTNSNGSISDEKIETERNESAPTNPDKFGSDTNSTNNSDSTGGENPNNGESSGNNRGNIDNKNTVNANVGIANNSRHISASPGHMNATLSNNIGAKNGNVGSPRSGNNSEANGKDSGTSEIRSASFLSVGDQISLSVIALCIMGTAGLILYGIISKRVRKVRAQESNAPPTYPMYADLIEKENMHGYF